MNIQRPATRKPFSRRRAIQAGVGVAGLGIFAATRRGERPSEAAPLADHATPGLDDDLSVSRSGWETDFSQHNVSLSEFRGGGPPRDGIPPIDEPRYVSITEADDWLEELEPVIAVVRNDGVGTLQARAYPLQILIWHEIVNDELAGEPTLVTFCPLCNTAIAFERRLEPGGTVYDFGTTGNLRLSDLVMWDRQTETWWQQLSGEAVVGELTGAVLTPVPAQILGWSAFKDAYPDADVLSRETGFDRPYGENPYPGYDDIDSSPFLFDGETDSRLPAMERVVGLTVGDEAVAYPFETLVESGAVNDQIEGQPIAIFHTGGARSALDSGEIAAGADVGQAGVFSRDVDGQTLTFEPDGDQFTDAETGSAWDITGTALAGPLAGTTLTPLPHTVVFWFAWGAFQPETRVWQPGG